jgi:hypothetical protein
MILKYPVPFGAMPKLVYDLAKAHGVGRQLPLARIFVDALKSCQKVRVILDAPDMADIFFDYEASNADRPVADEAVI